MTDLIVGEVVKLKSGGHDMTVQEVTEDAIACIWSDGNRVRSEKFNPSLLSKSGAVTAVNRRIVYSDKGVDELVAEIRLAGTSTDDTGFYITDEGLRSILKRELGPNKSN
jgi:uncharacterized protein YodC (DUF2158 family)